LLQLWSDAELEFHQTLISACGSALLMELHLIVYYRYRQIKVEADQVLTDLAANIKEHKGIVDAAVSGNQDVMRRRIFEHFKRHLIPDGTHPMSLAS
jgi:DNA-binding GntR family transcriptional regulator